MENIKEKLFEIIQTYKIECILMSLAVIMSVISLGLYFNSTVQVHASSHEEKVSKPQTTPQITRAHIFVEISGSVINPDVYEVTSGARLKDAIQLAGGLAENADKNFFARNYNLARLLVDQEKIHIPSISEVSSGIFVENKKLLQSSQSTNTKQNTNNTSHKININSAAINELDGLPGVGQVTAQSIIDNRPYNNLDELIDKKVVKSNVYDQIKDLIEL